MGPILLTFGSTEEGEGAAQGEATEEGQAEDHTEQGVGWSRLATDISVGLGTDGRFATDPGARVVGRGLG